MAIFVNNKHEKKSYAGSAIFLLTSWVYGQNFNAACTVWL